MRHKTLLTTGEVAAHCAVSYEAVNNWIRGGRLKAYTTPGGHYRIRLDDFETFLAASGLPPFEEGSSHKRKLLVVDDQAEIVAAVMSFFRETGGYEVATASNGYEAGIQVVTFDPDLVMSDLMLPCMNGLEVCQTIKTTPATQHILVLAITGYPDEYPREQAVACGADGYLVKPFTMEVLKQHVEALFAQHPRRPRAVWVS